MEGTISYSDFLANLRDIIKLAEELKEKWEMQFCKSGSENVSFLVGRSVLHKRKGPNHSDGTKPDSSNDGIHSYDHLAVPEDPDEFTDTVEDERHCADIHTVASSNPDDIPELIQAEYHVVYSPSYSVPVLYYTACRSDGSLLSLEEAWDMVPVSYEERLRHRRWTFLTQQEHPYLGRPFFQLHPCHTADLMKAASSSHRSSNYVVTWLSSVGPVVGLNLPLAFASLC